MAMPARTTRGTAQHLDDLRALYVRTTDPRPQMRRRCRGEMTLGTGTGSVPRSHREATHPQRHYCMPRLRTYVRNIIPDPRPPTLRESGGSGVHFAAAPFFYVFIF